MLFNSHVPFLFFQLIKLDGASHFIESEKKLNTRKTQSAKNLELFWSRLGQSCVDSIRHRSDHLSHVLGDVLLHVLWRDCQRICMLHALKRNKSV